MTSPISRTPIGLDATAVVDAALELIDETGIDAFTMRALADRLGVKAPTIYWHVGSRDDLLAAMVDRVLTTMAGIGRTRGPWDARLRRLLERSHAQLLAHPPVLRLIGTIHSREIAALGAELIDIFTAAGFGDADAATYSRITLGHIMRTALGAVITPDYLERDPEDERRQRVKPELLAPELPHVVALMTRFDAKQDHRLVTKVFIDGIAAQLP